MINGDSFKQEITAELDVVQVTKHLFYSHSIYSFVERCEW